MLAVTCYVIAMGTCRCGKQLVGRQTSHCSGECKNKFNVAEWRRNLKRRAVVHLGGRCVWCGYDKCVAALAFHHRGNKKFSIAGNGNTRSWARVVKELGNCDLVCINCHAEIHEAERYSSVALR